MRRWRRARAAAALSCLAIAVLLQQFAVVAEGRAPSLPRTQERAHGDAEGHVHARPRGHSGSGLPPSTGARATTTTVHHAVGVVGASVRFDASAAGGAARWCRKSRGRKAAGDAGTAAGACATDDDKRRIPTGANPLHNR